METPNADLHNTRYGRECQRATIGEYSTQISVRQNGATTVNNDIYIYIYIYLYTDVFFVDMMYTVVNKKIYRYLKTKKIRNYI